MAEKRSPTAVRFMRLSEEPEATGQGFVILNHELAVKGLKWIKKNVKNENIHRSAIDSRIVIEEEFTRQEKLQAQQRAEAEKERKAQQQRTAETEKADERAQKLQVKRDLLEQHQADLV